MPPHPPAPSPKRRGGARHTSPRWGEVGRNGVPAGRGDHDVHRHPLVPTLRVGALYGLCYPHRMSRDLAAQFQREQLHRAAADGDLARVDDLIARKYPVNRFDDLGYTPLHYAVREKQLDI